MRIRSTPNCLSAPAPQKKMPPRSGCQWVEGEPLCPPRGAHGGEPSSSSPRRALISAALRHPKGSGRHPKRWGLAPLRRAPGDAGRRRALPRAPIPKRAEPGGQPDPTEKVAPARRATGSRRETRAWVGIATCRGRNYAQVASLEETGGGCWLEGFWKSPSLLVPSPPPPPPSPFPPARSPKAPFPGSARAGEG